MRGQKRVFIVDFDNTILDIERLKQEVILKFPNKKAFNSEYKKAKISGYFDPELLPPSYRDFFYKAQFKKHLFKNSISNLKELKKLGRVIIFSFGHSEYQKTKIESSGIGDIVGQKNIIVVQDKLKGTEKLIRDLQKEKYSQIVIFDDVAEVLEKAFNTNPQTVTVWIKYGKHKNKVPLTRSAVTFEAGSFHESVEKIKRLVATVTVPDTHLKLPILRGIDKNQTSALITYTQSDKKVSKCTHDIERFKNSKTFGTWQKRGKTIYTLTNAKGKLLGLIWFARKKYGIFPFTFAIRTYPPVRGKGISFKFLKTVYEEFRNKYTNSGLWLAMQPGNIPAEKLYKKFGFKTSSINKNGEVIMTYKH